MSVTSVQCPDCHQWKRSDGSCGCRSACPLPSAEATQLLSAMRQVERFKQYPMAVQVQLLRWFQRQVGQEAVCPLCAGKGYVADAPGERPARD